MASYLDDGGHQWEDGVELVGAELLARAIGVRRMGVRARPWWRDATVQCMVVTLELRLLLSMGGERASEAREVCEQAFTARCGVVGTAGLATAHGRWWPSAKQCVLDRAKWVAITTWEGGGDGRPGHV